MSRQAPGQLHPYLLSALVEQSPDAIFVKDVEGRVVLTNPAADKSFPCMRGKNLHEMLGDQDEVARLEAMDQQVLATGQAISYETQPTVNGERRVFQVHKAPYRGPDGEIAGVICTARDVTRLWRTEQRQTARFLITQLLSDARDLAQIAPEVLRAICMSNGMAFGALWMVNGPHLRPLGWWQESASLAPIAETCRTVRIERGSGVTGRAWATGEVTCSTQLQNDRDAHLVAAAGLDLQACFAFPILHGREVLGVIQLMQRKPGEPEAELLLLLSALSTQIGQFLHRRVAEQRLQRLVDACSRLLASLSVEAVVQVLRDIAHEVMQADGFAIWRCDGAPPTWRIVVADGLSDAYRREMIFRFPTGSLDEMPPAYGVEDVRLDPRLAPRLPLYQAEGIAAMMMSPLRVGADAGTLVFYYRQPRQFLEADFRTTTALASLAGTALHTAEQHEARADMRRLAETLVPLMADAGAVDAGEPVLAGSSDAGLVELVQVGTLALLTLESSGRQLTERHLALAVELVRRLR